MGNKEKAIKFWELVIEKYGDVLLASHLEGIKSGDKDWFRDGSLILTVAASHSRIGRIGFDDNRYNQIQNDIQLIANSIEFDLGLLQN